MDPLFNPDTVVGPHLRGQRAVLRPRERQMAVRDRAMIEAER